MVDNLHSEYYYGGCIRSNTTQRRKRNNVEENYCCIHFLSLLLAIHILKYFDDYLTFTFKMVIFYLYVKYTIFNFSNNNHDIRQWFLLKFTDCRIVIITVILIHFYSGAFTQNIYRFLCNNFQLVLQLMLKEYLVNLLHLLIVSFEK